MSQIPPAVRVALLLSVASLILLEIVLLRSRRINAYDWRESAASFGIAIGQRLMGVAAAWLLWPLYTWIYAHRLFSFGAGSWWGLALLFLGVEFFYYWEHRLSHRVRWLWATHAVHHSPQHLNFSAAYRLGLTGLVSGVPLFLLPMMWLGFPPLAVLAMMGINLLYQFWLHTELVPALPWFDAVFNSPANHRVHHGSNAEYLDRNFGGILIVFDRLFGSYVAESAQIPRRYGLAHCKPSYNPLVLAFREWVQMFRDLRRASSLASGLKSLISPPA